MNASWFDAHKRAGTHTALAPASPKSDDRAMTRTLKTIAAISVICAVGIALGSRLRTSKRSPTSPSVEAESIGTSDTTQASPDRRSFGPTDDSLSTDSAAEGTGHTKPTDNHRRAAIAADKGRNAISPGGARGRTSNSPVKASLKASGSQSGSVNSTVTEKTLHTLDLFSKVVSIDDRIREKLLAAAVDKSVRYSDIIQLANDPNLSTDDRLKLSGEMYNQYRQSVVDLLGPQNGQLYLDLSAASRFAPIAEDFAARCAAAGEPLTPAAQVSIVINLSKNLNDPEHPRRPLILPNGMLFEENQAYDSAAKVLSPAQLSIFKQLWAEHPYPNR